MLDLIISSTILSTLHALLPNHWLPVLAISQKQGWKFRETIVITFFVALMHSLSTILIGVILAFAGSQLESADIYFIEFIAPGILVILGLYFIWQHYRHHHFHLHGKIQPEKHSKARIIFLLLVAMFFSPCLEISAFFLAAGGIGWTSVAIIALVYLVVSVIGMVTFVTFTAKGIEKTNWHPLEHNAGIISGIVMILAGISFFFLH
jgi:putative Mn2+ efflux pump MntP